VWLNTCTWAWLASTIVPSIQIFFASAAIMGFSGSWGRKHALRSRPGRMRGDY
jgi:hypothetical protein